MRGQSTLKPSVRSSTYGWNSAILIRVDSSGSARPKYWKTVLYSPITTPRLPVASTLRGVSPSTHFSDQTLTRLSPLAPHLLQQMPPELVRFASHARGPCSSCYAGHQIGAWSVRSQFGR